MKNKEDRIEKRKTKRDTVSEWAQSFSRFLILNQQWEARGRSTTRTSNERFGSKLSLLPIFLAASPSKIFSILLLCLWLKLRQRNFLSDLELCPQGLPTRTMDPNVLRRNHKRACNATWHGPMHSWVETKTWWLLKNIVITASHYQEKQHRTSLIIKCYYVC